MKKNFTTSELPHVWAHQKQEQGKAGSFYFENKTIYSYGAHFPIATHLDDGQTVAFTTRTYSNTTAKHIRNTRYAISHKTLLLCNDPKQAANGHHTQNINSFIVDIQRELNNITPRTRKPDVMVSAALQKLSLLNTYIGYFKIKPSKEVKAIAKICNSTNVVEITKEKQAKAKQQQERKELAAQKRFLALVKDWKAYGKTQHVNDVHATYLRTDGQLVETSKGIKLSIPRAKMYYNWVISTGNCTGCNFEMEQYKVTSLTDAHLVVGCHNIPLTEIKEIAKKLKF